MKFFSLWIFALVQSVVAFQYDFSDFFQKIKTEQAPQNKVKALDKSSEWFRALMRVHFMNELRTNIMNLSGNRQNNGMGTIHKDITLAFTKPFNPFTTTNGLISYMNNVLYEPVARTLSQFFSCGWTNTRQS